MIWGEGVWDILIRIEIKMNDLIEKLGAADEDNYIYLDKDGNAQLCIEINLKWNLLINKRFVITCSSE